MAKKPGEHPSYPGEQISDPDRFAEPDPIAQERVELERFLLNPNIDSKSEDYKNAVRRIRELNDRFKADKGSLHAWSNEELSSALEDGSTPLDVAEHIKAILGLRNEGRPLPKKYRK